MLNNKYIDMDIAEEILNKQYQEFPNSATLDISAFVLDPTSMVMLIGFNKEFIVKFESTLGIRPLLKVIVKDILRLENNFDSFFSTTIDKTAYALLQEDFAKPYDHLEYGPKRTLFSLTALPWTATPIRELIDNLKELEGVRSIRICKYTDYAPGVSSGFTVKDWNSKYASYDAHPCVIRDEKITPNQVRAALGLDDVTVSNTEDILKPKSYEMVDGRSVYDWMSVLFQSNPNLNSDDIMYLTLMLKYIPRAGSKIYPGMTAEESKNADLDKVITIAKDWQDKRKGVK